MNTTVNGTSESMVKYVGKYRYVFRVFFLVFYKYVHVLMPLQLRLRLRLRLSTCCTCFRATDHSYSEVQLRTSKYVL